MGTVFKKSGKYLRYSEYRTHTGKHQKAEWVNDLQQATVFHTMPPLRLRQDEQLWAAEKLEATETRTVVLKPGGFEMTNLTERYKAREEILDMALSHGARVTGKPDGSEPIEIIFSIKAWQSFDHGLGCIMLAESSSDCTGKENGS